MRMLSLLALACLLAACSDPALVDPAARPAVQSGKPGAPRIILRPRAGYFRCGLPPDEDGKTCQFVPYTDTSLLKALS